MTKDVLETPNFVLQYESDEDQQTISDLAKALESCYDRVRLDLGTVAVHRTNVVVHPTLESLHDAFSFAQVPDWLAGFAVNEIIHILSPAHPCNSHSYGDILAIAAHEYVHVALRTFKSQPAAYLEEGVASYEARQDANVQVRLRRWKRAGALLGVNQLKHLSMARSAEELYVYGYAYVAFIVENFGFRSLVSLLEGQPSHRVLNTSSNVLELDWFDFLGQLSEGTCRN